ncbi:hypothetical protein AND_003139 [Anopheles darlingi]|uniref:Uncharacterized protein n=1 Tax=Anopheles darlingi TaxID=43151 RepID=W5JQR9_ANODA|nr:UPF0488 protein CG14286 [Anopheles darlingi]ETN65099.1 hypothetical protein AND_003139 [Anopheles darlingi]
MAPPKPRLHKTTGKLKSIPRPKDSDVPTPASGPTTPSPTQNSEPHPDPDQQFELELYWCIQQLESQLPNLQGNTKKWTDTNKMINTLKSSNQPIIRKRQIMRTSFGDYRSKMAAEQQTLAVVEDNVRFEERKEKVKYHFVKKSAVLSGDKNFRFNFPATASVADAEEEDTSKEQTAKSERSRLSANDVVFAPSDNSFRFNFSVSST